jgi:hypothetical protein
VGDRDAITVSQVDHEADQEYHEPPAANGGGSFPLSVMSKIVQEIVVVASTEEDYIPRYD